MRLQAHVLCYELATTGNTARTHIYTRFPSHDVSYVTNSVVILSVIPDSCTQLQFSYQSNYILFSTHFFLFITKTRYLDEQVYN